MKKKKAKHGKALSIAFWMAIPSTFALGALCLITFLILFDKRLFEPEVWSLFAFGIVASISVVVTSELTRLRVFVHELKHALAVFLSGGTLKHFEVSAHSGEIGYEIEKDQAHYMPIIGLAPYCAPLISLPVLCAALFFENGSRELYGLALGLALGMDIAFGWSEIDPRQTDFRGVAGGFFASALYIAGVTFLWVNACLLWVVGGRTAFVYAGYLGLRLVGLFTKQYFSGR